MVDRYSIPWCYGVCGCTGSPFLKQLKVLLGSDEALEEEGPRVDPHSTVLNCQVDPSLTERSEALKKKLYTINYPHKIQPNYLR